MARPTSHNARVDTEDMQKLLLIRKRAQSDTTCDPEEQRKLIYHATAMIEIYSKRAVEKGPESKRSPSRKAANGG